MKVRVERFMEFQFLDAWFLHPEFVDTVENLWKVEPSHLKTKMEALKVGLLEWNKQSFRNIFELKKRCKARLAGIQRTLTLGYSPFLVKLESKLMHEFNDILYQEDSYWRQKARGR